MDFRCLKCGSTNYFVKTAIFPQKDPGLKIHLGTYYLKTCMDCGFTEMYSAEIVDNEFEKNEKLTTEF